MDLSTSQAGRRERFPTSGYLRGTRESRATQRSSRISLLPSRNSQEMPTTLGSAGRSTVLARRVERQQHYVNSNKGTSYLYTKAFNF